MRAGVALDLLGGRGERPPGERLRLGLAPAPADRKLRRADAASGAIGEEALHAAVLERMERDRRQAPALAQQLPGGGQRPVERVQLVVDGDPDRLEGPLRRVAAPEAVGGRDRGANRLDQVGGGLQRAAADDLARDRPGVALLSVLADDPGEPILRATR